MQTIALTPEAHLAALVFASQTAIVSTDTAGVVLSWNPSAERLSGRTADEVIGRHIAAVVPPEVRSWAPALLARVIDEAGTERAETDWTLDDGSVIRVELTLAPIAAPDGDVGGASITARDVTARYHAERRLRESEERLAVIVETAHEAFIGMDEDGRITGWNRAAEALFGWSRDEVLGLPLEETIIPPAQRGHHEGGRRRFVATGESRIMGRRLDLTAVCRDGLEVPVELAVEPARVAGRWVFNAFLRDLRERDGAEAARAHLAAIVESSGDAIIACGPDGTILSWNPAAERLYGYTATEAIDRSLAMLLPSGDEHEQREIAGPWRPASSVASRRGASIATGTCSTSSPRSRPPATRRARSSARRSSCATSASACGPSAHSPR